MKVKAEKQSGKLMIVFVPESQSESLNLGRLISGTYGPRESVVTSLSTGEVSGVSVAFYDLVDCCVFAPQESPNNHDKGVS